MLVPVAEFTMRLGHVSFRNADSDILLSNVNLDWVGHYGCLGWRWSELTGYLTFFSVISFQVILSNGMLSALLMRQAIVVLLSDATTAG